MPLKACTIHQVRSDAPHELGAHGRSRCGGGCLPVQIYLGAKTQNRSVLAPPSDTISPTRQQFLTSIHRFFRQPRKRNKELMSACTEGGTAPILTEHLSLAIVGGLPDASQYFHNGLSALFTCYPAVPGSPALRITSSVSSRPARELLLYFASFVLIIIRYHQPIP